MTEKQRIIKTVYLSGAMDFVSKERGKTWRKEAEELLDANDIDVFNPYRKPLCPKGTTQKRGVVMRQDLRIIEQCDLLVVNLSQTVTCPHCGKDTKRGVESHGSSSECQFAWERNIPIVAFIGEREEIPTWLDEHAEFVCRDLETACKYIVNYNHRKEGGDEGTPVSVSQYISEEKK